MTGFMTYKDRSGSWEFYIANDYHYWVVLKSAIANYLHGKKMLVQFEDDPEYYYEGRLSVNEFKSQAVNSTITINYVLRPYKYSIQSENWDWLWDPFNFVTGVIQQRHDIEVPASVLIVGGRMRGYPTLVASTSGITVSLNGGNATTLSQGRNVMTDMLLDEGDNTLTFGGTGTVDIEYREGSL